MWSLRSSFTGHYFLSKRVTEPTPISNLVLQQAQNIAELQEISISRPSSSDYSLDREGNKLMETLKLGKMAYLA